MTINENREYVIEGSDLLQLSDVLTRINAMSGQQIDGDMLRDLVQKAQLHAGSAVELDFSVEACVDDNRISQS